jgi:hypothetical protein
VWAVIKLTGNGFIPKRLHMENSSSFNPSDYTVAIKNRGRPDRPWRWEINAAGKNKAVLQSDFFESMSAATRAGKVALAKFREKKAA